MSSHFTHNTSNYNSYSHSDESKYSNNYSDSIIPVYILSTNSSSCIQLRKCFSSSLFSCHVLNVPQVLSFSPNYKHTSSSIQESSRFHKALSTAYSEYPNSYCIIIKDNSVTNCSSRDIDEIVTKALEIGKYEKKWDLFYLTKWLDRCDLYKSPTYVRNKQTALISTYSPHGAQAICFSPHARNVLLGETPFHKTSEYCHLNKPLSSYLNECIEKGYFKAIGAFPNIFDYDVTKSSGVTDLAKLSLCRRPENNGNEKKGPLPFLIFVGVVIGTLLLVWALYYLGPQYRRRDNSVQKNT